MSDRLTAGAALREAVKHARAFAMKQEACTLTSTCPACVLVKQIDLALAAYDAAPEHVCGAEMGGDDAD